jgi:hypothetical protein
VSAFFNILLLPLTLLTRLVCAYPVAAIAAGLAATVLALLLDDRVTASCFAMFMSIVLIWYDETRRPSPPEEGGAQAA